MASIMSHDPFHPPNFDKLDRGSYNQKKLLTKKTEKLLIKKTLKTKKLKLKIKKNGCKTLSASI